MTDYAQNLIEVYENIIELQKQKREVIGKRDIDSLGSVDEKIVTLYNQALDIAKKRELMNPSKEQSEKINVLYKEMDKLQKINQAIVEQLLYLINQIFTGVMKIINCNSIEYTMTGKSHSNEDYGLSTIREEA